MCSHSFRWQHNKRGGTTENLTDWRLQHHTPSTDYVIVLRGELTVVTPPAAFDVVDGRGSYGKVEETVARAGDVVVQRGCMHA